MDRLLNLDTELEDAVGDFCLLTCRTSFTAPDTAVAHATTPYVVYRQNERLLVHAASWDPHGLVLSCTSDYTKVTEEYLFTRVVSKKPQLMNIRQAVETGLVPATKVSPVVWVAVSGGCVQGARSNVPGLELRIHDEDDLRTEGLDSDEREAQWKENTSGLDAIY